MQKMKHMENTAPAGIGEWLDLDVDGALPASSREPFERALEAQPELAAERHRLERLHELLVADRIAVAPDFGERVMASLPVAPWQRSVGASTWLLPAALVTLTGIAAALLLGSSWLAGHPVLGLFVVLFDFLQATTLAGAGLLFASWRGIGFGLGEVFAGSPAALGVFGVAVLLLDLLVLSLLRRRRPAEVEVSGGE
jgi:anti-sigma factor RsiW